MAKKSPHYDVVVIGTGPGGEGAAMKAVKRGKRVAVVERHQEVGGGCTHWGTIPSKALRYSIQQYVAFTKGSLFREVARDVQIDLPFLLRSARRVVEQQTRLRQSFYDRNEVEILQGHARFVSAHEIEIRGRGNRKTRLSADHFVIAVGSRPYRPPDVDFEHPRVLDSDKILEIEETPRTIIVYGAGVVGCEYASMLRNFGVKVNLVNTRERLLTFLDDEISDALSYHLRDLGTVIRHNEEYERVETREDRVVMHLQSGKKIAGDYLLWANGRSGNTHDLGLENTKIKPDDRGNLKVDANYRTEEKHIYAVGDAVGWPALASSAYDQGRYAATHIVYGKTDHKLLALVPTGIYTSPEISSIGETERELTARKVPYEVGHALFKSLARQQITGRRAGMLKILFHRESLQILGIHCFGHQAAEIIHIGQAIMSQEGKANSLLYFTNTTFNYPTMAEAYRVAALNGINRIKDELGSK